MAEVLDIVGALLVCVGAFFCLAAAVGIVRFPDVLTRMHAATKPQSFGVLVALTGVMLSMRTWHATALGLLIIVLQLITSPTAAHMVARTAYRTGQWDDGHAVVDELGQDIADAGLRRRFEDEGQVPGG